MNATGAGARQGWQCPICGRVYSPDVPTCWGHARGKVFQEGIALRSAVAGEPIAIKLPNGVTVAGELAEKVNVGDSVVQREKDARWLRKAGPLGG